MRGRVAGAAVFAVLLAAGPLLGSFALSVLALVFLFAFLGQSWNVMTGLAGQLSLGHGLFVGIGAYTVGLLKTRYALSPWLGLPAGAALAAVAGAAVGWLGFRFAVRGVYFALLTIAFAEFGRVVASNWALVGGSGGLFLPALPAGGGGLGALRGGPLFTYTATLLLAAAGTGFADALHRSSLGYVWRAMRDDEDAARALGVRVFRHRVLATSVSAAMAGVGGGAWCQMNGAVFADSAMGLSMSVDILIPPIVGGLGTAFGPLVGALFTVPLSQATELLSQRWHVFGLSTLAYGVALILVVRFLPRGIWPTLAGVFSRR